MTEVLLKRVTELLGHGVDLRWNAPYGEVFRAVFFSNHDPLKRRHTMFSETLDGVLAKIVTSEEALAAMSESERRDMVLESERLDREAQQVMDTFRERDRG